MTALLTARDVLERLLAIAHEHPDAVNPIGPTGSCEYDDGNGHHCIVGTLAAELGWDLDIASGTAQLAVGWGWPITSAAAFSLAAVQIAADNEPPHTCEASPIPWGEVIPTIEAELARTPDESPTLAAGGS